MSKKMVMIKWVDAKFCSGIHSEQEAREHEMSVFESIGYLIDKTKLATIIAGEHDNNGEYRSILLVPTGSILSISNLELVVSV